MRVVYWVAITLVVLGLLIGGTVSKVLGVAVATLAIAAYSRSRRTTSQPLALRSPREGGGPTPSRGSSRTPSERTGRGSSPIHNPPNPHGEPFEPWSQHTTQREVAGEYYRLDNVKRLFTRAGARVDAPGGAELRHPAALVPDGGNPYDPNAVAVFVQGLHVGYLERPNAATYHQAIAAATTSYGRVINVSSRQWMGPGSRGDLIARVTLDLPAPNGFVPVNGLPKGGVELPTGSTVQVAQEDQHMDILRPILEAHGHEVPVAATLHCVTQARARSTLDVVEVRIDGQRVGVLSPTQSGNFRELVRHLEERGRLPVARAVLRGNPVKAEVTLFIAKPQDIEPQWFTAALG